MKYTIKFGKHPPTGDLTIQILDNKVNWVAGILRWITTEEAKTNILNAIDNVQSDKISEAFYSDELNEIKITKGWVYWNRELTSDYDTSSAKPIELSEFKKLLEVWWNKYVETEGEPEV